MKLIILFILSVAAGSRPTQETPTTEMTELDIAERLLSIVTHKTDISDTNEHDSLRFLSNIVQIDFENESPVEISESVNSSQPIIRIKEDTQRIRPYLFNLSPMLMPLTVITLIMNFLTLIISLILYAKYPVIQKSSRIYLSQPDRYQESSSLTSSCE